MLKLLSIIRNEIRLLAKDIPGLMILFIMPMFLVLILTTLHSVEEQHPKKLLLFVVNQDHGKIGNKFITKLQETDKFNITLADTKKITIEQAKNQIINGQYQMLLVLPQGLTTNIKNYATWLAKKEDHKPPLKKVSVFLDPTVPVSIKNSIDAELQKFNLRLQIEALQEILKKITSSKKYDQEQLAVNTSVEYASSQTHSLKPNAVQQYVPAWTIFGMFLIMIPLAGVFVKEREQGIIQRLATAPVYRSTYLLGRIITFVMINMIQLFLMLSLGVYVLPFIGLPALELFAHLPEVTLLGLCISLAATGFGVLLGCYAKTFEQAMALGPTLIVIFAAIGGIMAPLYLMPEQLRLLSAYSPLYWSQHSFITIFVRDGSLGVLWPDMAKLLTFFLVTLILSKIRFMKRG